MEDRKYNERADQNARGWALDRRDVLRLGCAGALSVLLAGCRQGEQAGQAPVVVYTSIDDFIARPIAQAVSQEAGIAINLVTDTEATKTTGLLQRLIAEKDNPTCDVWWSNEALATGMLARSGVLRDLPTEALPEDFASLPPHQRELRAQHWHGYALRSRVIAFNTGVFARSDAPATLDDLLAKAKPGRIAMAQPQFGTTRSFFAHLVARHGEQWTAALCEKLRAHRVQLLPGNSAVVRAIAQGSADAGLTDSDDVFVGQREGWNVDFAGPQDRSTPALEIDDAALLIPCTVGLIAQPPQKNQSAGTQQTARATRAATVAKALLSYQTEQLLGASEAVHRPIRTSVAEALAATDPRVLRIGTGPIAPWQQIADVAPRSDALLASEFPV